MEIAAEIRDAASAVARKQGITLALLFGSFAAGTAGEESDVDIAVRFQDRKPTLRRLLDVEAELTGIFPGREIDVASLERADPLFMKKIGERFVVLYEEPGEADAFRRLAFKRYRDHRKYLAMAGLRNRIVHEYDDIDPAKVFEAIEPALTDLPVYLKAVLSFTG